MGKPLLRTWGMSFDLSKMKPGQFGMVQGGRKLQSRGLNKEIPEGFFYPCEQEIEQLIDTRVQALVEEKVQEAIAQNHSHNATNIAFDNSTSNISANNVQGAIDELNNINNINASFVCFWAYRTIDYYQVGNAPISYNGIKYDFGDSYNVSGLFTVPIKGLYSFNIRYCSFRHEVQHFASLGINGNSRSYDIFESSLSPHEEHHTTVDLILNKNDNIGVYPSSVVGVHGDVHGRFSSSFQGRLVRQID